MCRTDPQEAAHMLVSIKVAVPPGRTSLGVDTAFTGLPNHAGWGLTCSAEWEAQQNLDTRHGTGTDRGAAQRTYMEQPG